MKQELTPDFIQPSILLAKFLFLVNNSNKSGKSDNKVLQMVPLFRDSLPRQARLRCRCEELEELAVELDLHLSTDLHF